MDSLVEDALEEAEEEEFEGDIEDLSGVDAEQVEEQTTEDQIIEDEEDTIETSPSPSAEREMGGNAAEGGMSDGELRGVLDTLKTEITVVGCGGGGGNTVARMAAEGIDGADLVALNTDVQHLLDINADSKLLVGKNLTQGRGAGSRPQVGEEAAQENIADIEQSISGSDMVFVTAGMGGGTGTGSAPVVARAAKEAGALTIAIVTLPFDTEGEVRKKNAESGLQRLREEADTVIVIPNDRILDVVGDMPVQKAFKVADEVLMRSVKGITELITNPGVVNLDFADVTTVMENGGVAMIGLGDSDSQNRAQDSVKSAIRSPLLDVDVSGASSVLVNVTGGNDMSIEEAEGVVEEIHERVDPDARIIWGTSVDEELDGKIQTMMVATGVKSPQMYSGTEDESVTTQTDDLDDIDYVE